MRRSLEVFERIRPNTPSGTHPRDTARSTQGGLKISLLAALRRAKSEIGTGAVAQLGERVVRNDEVSGSIPLGSTSSS